MANNYYVANEPNNLYRSTDAGVTYTDVVNGLGLVPSTSMQYKIATNDGEMYVTTITGGTSFALYVYGSGYSGIQDNQMQSNFTVYPNPVSDKLFITSTNLTGGSTINITDVTGKSVYKSVITSEQTTINTTDFVNGVYIIQIENKSSIASRKLVVNK